MVLLLGYFANPWLLSSKAAIWHSEVCGVWEYPSENTTAEEATRAEVVLRQKEARAGEYAKYCYEPWSRGQPLPVYCGFFAHRNIPFRETRPHGCPFPNSSVCEGTQVVKFDTGKQPASILGINQANPYVFRKTATCVPLSVEEPYVQEREAGNGDKVFKYYYGREVASDDPEEPLFDTSGNPFYWTVPTYDASVFTTGPEADGYWTPIEDLNPGHDNYLTLLFVRPLQIYYLGPSRDALFPTDLVLQFPDGDKLHIKSDPKARVLACVEETEFCEPSDSPCWPAHIRPDTSRNPGFWLMRLALKDSTIYNSIALRLGTALVAQDMVSQQLSLTLPEDHWMTETKRLFATSLALAQIKAWSIASGEDADLEEHWEDQTPDEAKAAGGLCNLLKFNSVGYTDVDLLAFVLLLVLPWPITAMLSTRWSSINESFKPFVRQQDDTSHKRHRNAVQAVVDIETTQPTGPIDDQSHSPRQQSVVSLTSAAQGPGDSTAAPTLNAHEDDDLLVIKVVILPVWKLLVVGITCIISFWHGMRSASSRSLRQHN